ncbi:MAG: HEPN domain-containing protein [Rhodospirillaceae bacterium]|nr:HEPN domain-containing protein [Rhodospirillaceae bacterium]
MDEYFPAENAFLVSLERARSLCALQHYLLENNTAVLETTDMLRASVVLSVSAFDYLIHELFRIEVLVRLRNKKEIEYLQIPFNIGVLEKSKREELIDRFVRERNSHRTFVDPQKFSEALRCFVQSPWNNIVAQIGVQEENIKQRLRMIYRWRNRIAHEADINPVLAGIELWPIVNEDVIEAIADLEKIGLAAVSMIREA